MCSLYFLSKNTLQLNVALNLGIKHHRTFWPRLKGGEEFKDENRYIQTLGVDKIETESEP